MIKLSSWSPIQADIFRKYMISSSNFLKDFYLLIGFLNAYHIATFYTAFKAKH